MRKLKALLAILSLLGIIIGCTEATTTEVITNDKKPEYKISFNANGGKGKMSDINIIAETSIILPENTFTRDNYTFMGWATTANGEVMFKNGAIFEGLYSNVTLYAKWEKKVVPVVKITITFDVNEAGGTAPTAIETTLNKNVDLPVLTNAKFSHWNTKADGSGQSYNGTATFTESVTLYAILLAENAHKITYELDGGVNNPQNLFSFTEEDTVTLKNPTKNGYKFAGWYETADFSGSVLKGWFAGDKTANVILYAKWEKEATPVVKITITFDVNGAGGTAPTAIETTPDENVELPVLTNAKFSHWNTSPDGSGQSYNGTGTFTESVTLYAILLAENAHTITYELNGGVNHSKSPYSFTEDEAVILREPTKDGYIFVGWYETADFSGEKIELWYKGDKTANVTFYAKWEMVYTITYDANGGSGEMNKQEFIAGEEQKLNENTFTYDGNVFVKWNTKPDGSGINYINGESYSFSENVTLYAQWITKLPPLEAGYFRINFTGTTIPMYIWIWGDFDSSEISKCTAWGDKAFPLTGKNGDFFAFDIKLVDNPAQVNFIILTDGWKKLSGDADITFKFPQKYKEIWVDTTGKIWVDTEQTKEPAGLLSASITGGNEITMVTTGIDSVAATDFEVTDKNGNPINVTNATTTKLTIDNTDYINKAPYSVVYTDTDKNKDTVIANTRSSLFLENDKTFNGGELIIPDGTISIDSSAFESCENLTSVTIPDSVTSIGNAAFSGCSSLESVTIGNGVASIGWGAFSGCSSLESVTIGNGVASIGGGVFYGCSSLTIFNVSADNYYYSSSDDGKILYNKDKTQIIAYPSATGNITIPDSVITIGSNAFSGCSSLTSVTTPDSMTSIDDGAFASCSNLTSVTIGDSVTSIGSSAFYGCSSLTSVVIPDSVTSIGNGVFSGCSSLESVYITNLTAWINIEFVNASSNPLYNGADLYLNGSSVTDLVIPNGMTSIGKYVFYGCSSLTGVVIPDSVISIGEGTFSYCNNLASVTIPDSVTSIGNGVFSNCNNLASVTIGNSVTSIGNGVFFNCSSLESVTIGNSVTSIGGSAFYGCNNLTIVNYKGTQEQWGQISIGSENGYLISATINYNYTGE